MSKVSYNVLGIVVGVATTAGTAIIVIAIALYYDFGSCC